MTYDEMLTLYKKALNQCPRFALKGKTMPYTSANGYMFSLLNKNGELGIRFSKTVQEKYMQHLATTYFISYGATMKGYILIPESLAQTPEKLVDYFNESYDYVMTLEPK